MENRGGTSIEELMRSGMNTSSEDSTIVDSILQEINQDKESQMKEKQAQQMISQQQMEAQQHQQQQQLAHQQMMKEQHMANQQMLREKMLQEQVMKEKLMQQMQEQNSGRDSGRKSNEEDNYDSAMNLFGEFKSSLIFFFIFITMNIIQVNSFVCDTLKIDNNNIYVLLKGFIATIIFFFGTKIINKFM